ncbi:MAG: cation diffusion facilitator family transporter [Candidatus Sericytochromatia bacterium]
MADTHPRFDPRQVAMTASLAVAVLMLVGKLGAAWLTGSAAILSDALESVIHIVATGIAAYGVWLTSQPADEDHHYGHGRFAYFSAGFEGALIGIAAIAILYVSVHALIVGPELHQLDLGVAITGGLALVNLGLGLFLVRVGKRHRALAVEANGRHVLTDVWTSGAVVVGVLLVWWTGLTWLDPVIAILAALNILRSGSGLIKDSIGGLMDQVDPAETARLVEALEASVASGQIGAYHQLRFRRVGDQVHLEVHLLMPGGLSLKEAHQRACAVEARLTEQFPEDRVLLTTHLEPEEHDCAHPDGHREFPDPLT